MRTITTQIYSQAAACILFTQFWKEMYGLVSILERAVMARKRYVIDCHSIFRLRLLQLGNIAKLIRRCYKIKIQQVINTLNFLFDFSTAVEYVLYVTPL